MSEVVDASFPTKRAELKTILPHLDPAWHSYLMMGGDTTGAAGYALPESVYRVPVAAGDHDPVESARGRLDATGTRIAVLDPGNTPSISAIANADLAAAVARATNDWLAAEWLERDERFRGSIAVGVRDPALAVAEVRRAGEDRRFVQVLLSCPPSLLGDRSLHPIYQAANELGLPVALRVGGEFTGANKGLTGSGFPATTFEYELGAVYAAQPHVLNLALNGVFDRFPDLRVIFSGYGVAWLPSLLWRADREFRLGRLERPRALSRPPSEIIAEHLRFTTCPLELPATGVELAMLLALVDAKRLLVYGSGALGDSPADLADLSEDWRRAVLGENAVDLFKLAVAA